MNCAADILNPGDRVRVRDMKPREGRVAKHEAHPCMTPWCVSVDFDGDGGPSLCKPANLEVLRDGRWTPVAE